MRHANRRLGIRGHLRIWNKARVCNSGFCLGTRFMHKTQERQQQNFPNQTHQSRRVSARTWLRAQFRRRLGCRRRASTAVTRRRNKVSVQLASFISNVHVHWFLDPATHFTTSLHFTVQSHFLICCHCFGGSSGQIVLQGVGCTSVCTPSLHGRGGLAGLTRMISARNTSGWWVSKKHRLHFFPRLSPLQAALRLRLLKTKSFVKCVEI